MPPRDVPLAADVDGEPPVVGTPVAPPLAAVQPSASAVRADAKGRVGNTVTQVGVPGFLVTIGVWLCQLAEIDLDPGPGTDMPTIVSTALVGLLAWGMARWMNREGLSASDEA